MTVEAITQSASQEKALLQNWFETVQFDVESEGIPKLAAEDDDEGRSLPEPEAEQQNITASNLEFEDLMAELRKRDPENPF